MQEDRLMGDIVDFWEKKEKEVKEETTTDKISEMFKTLQELGYNIDEMGDILTSEGSKLILAGAGSGKTTVLILKIIFGLESGQLKKTREVNGMTVETPANILVCTFLKSGAEELRQSFMEWCVRLGVSGVDMRYIHFKTIHAEVYQALQEMGIQINIMLDTDRLVRSVMKTLKIQSVVNRTGNTTIDEVSDIASLISYLRNMVDSGKYNHPLISEYSLDKVTIDNMLVQYKQLKMIEGKMDFEDLQEMLLDGLQKNPKVVEFIQSRYDYVYVDEFQDTSQLQYEILKYYFDGAKKVMCIGDDDQCVVGNELVNTEEGVKKIEEVVEGDRVLTALGRGQLGYREVDKVTKKQVDTEVVKIETESGKTLRATHDHIIYTKVESDPHKYDVYLMYRRDIGYRVGVVCGARRGKQGKTRVGIAQRMNKEKADKIWVLKRFETREEALFYEDKITKEYGILQHVFKLERTSGYEPRLTNETLKEKHKKKNSKKQGLKILKDKGLDYNYPHYVPKAKGVKCTLNYNMLSSSLKTGSGERKSIISADTTNQEYKEILEEYLSVRTRPAKGKRQQYYTATNTTNDIERQYKLLKEIKKECETKGVILEVKKRVQLTEEYYNFMPMSNVIEGMSIVIEEDGEMREEKVKKVTKEVYQGIVCDLSVPATRNFIVNSMVVSNCIYSWRGSDIDIINRRFREDYNPDVMQLNTNYRCATNILDAIIPSITQNTNRQEKQLKSHKEGGSVEVVVDGDVTHLLDNIKADLGRGETVGVLARTNADLLIPSMLIELDELEIGYGLSKSVSLSSRIPSQVLSVMDLVTKRYTGEFSKALDLFVPRYRQYQVGMFCEVLYSNKEVNVYNISADDVRYSTPDVYPVIEIIKRHGQDGARGAYTELLTKMEQEVYTGESMYAAKARDFVHYMRRIINEHPVVQKMSLDEIQVLFRDTLPIVMSKRKGLESKQFLNLSTVHEAKGKEWANVYIWNNVDGSFPNSVGKRPLTPSEFEEERRVHYIAWTRPKKKLTVYTRSERQGGFLAECDLSGAKITETKGIESKTGLSNTQETLVFTKKKEKKTPREIFESYYAKYTGFEWVVRTEGYNLDLCESRMGGKEAIYEALKEQGVLEYPSDMVEDAITAAIESMKNQR